MSREEILEILKEIFLDVLDYDEELTEETSKEDIEEWDSMSHILLLNKIQKRFNIQFEMSNLIKYNSVGKIIDGILGEK